MLTNQIVLVLGAGASADYGFPTGDQLTQRIHDLLTRDDGDMGVLERAGLNHDKLCRFRDDTDELDLPTLDLWIQEHKDYTNEAKAAIAAALISFEYDGAIKKPNPPKQHWYRFLFQRMLGEYADAGGGFRVSANNLHIFTFNYDRSLEFYFFKQLKKSYEQHALSLWSSLDIRHMYGSLGKIEFADPKTPNYRPFEASVTKDAVLTCMKSMTMVTEIPMVRMSRPDDLFLMLRTLGQASRICFLGFGYSPHNISLLSVSQAILSRSEVYGTAYHLPETQRRQVLDLLPGIQLGGWDDDVMTFLERNPILS